MFVIVPMMAGLSYHQMLRIALDGIGSGTPGWYLHILTPALATIMAWGWPKHWGVKLLVAYGLIFAAFSWVMQLALYSGCAIPSAKNGQLVFDTAKACLIDADHLAALSFPLTGIMMLALTACMGIFAYFQNRDERGVGN